MSDPRQQAMALLDQAASLEICLDNARQFLDLCNEATAISDVAGQIGRSDIYRRERDVFNQWNRTMCLNSAVAFVESYRTDLIAAARRCMEFVR